MEEGTEREREPIIRYAYIVYTTQDLHLRYLVT